jgi:D-alanyl-D-alanine carboxypeptidase
VLQSGLEAQLGELQAQHENVPGFAVAVIEDGALVSAATGAADPEGRPMTPDTPVRLASLTKTFVAVAVLRLHEDSQLDLDAPVRRFLTPEVVNVLAAEGYDLDAIRIRHLLAHSSGMADHAGTEAFMAQAVREPRRVWTPLEQIELMTEATEPLSASGERFAYSDTGYVVLGLVIERVTSQRLHEAVFSLLGIERLGLDGMWWDEVSAPAGMVPERAHQWMGGLDTFGLHGSLDAHGGGGIVASVEDVARFYDALFGRRVFEEPATLELMLEAPGHPEGSPYRYGLFEAEIGSSPVYLHGGFWGVYAAHSPAEGRTVTGVALDQDGYEALREVVHGIVGVGVPE